MNVSVSQMEKLLGCPAQWLKMYREKQKGLNGYHLGLGTSVHAAVEHNLQQKITSGDDLPLGDLLDAFDTAWANEQGGLDRFGRPKQPIYWYDNALGRDVTFEEVRASGHKMVAAYHTELSPLLQPTATEQAVRAAVPGSPGDFFTGFVDAVGVSNHPKYKGKPVIVDHKTGKAAWKPGKAANSLQAKGYAWEHWYRTGQLIEDFHFMIVLQPLFGREARVQFEPVRLTEEHLVYFERQLVECVKLAKGEAFPMRPEYEWHQYCPFRADCTPWEVVDVEVEDGPEVVL